MKLSNRVRVALVCAVLAASAFGIAAYWSLKQARDIIEAGLQQRLELALSSREQSLENYTTAVKEDLALFAGTRVVQEAVQEFAQAFRSLGDDPKREVQRLYITDNPNSTGQKQNLIKANDGSDYSRLHGLYHNWFLQLMKTRDYYDVFLVDSEGNVVYSAFKEDDLGTNLLTGKYAREAIGSTYRAVLKTIPGGIVASDFAPYTPSQGQPAAFEGISIRSEGKIVGALLIQLRLDPFNEIMRSTRNLGETGKTYLINGEGQVLTEARFTDNKSFELKASTEPVKRALNGASGILLATDYRGQDVLSIYRPFRWANLTWAAVAEMDVSELRNTDSDLWNSLLWLGCLVVLTSACLGWALAAPDDRTD